MKTIIKLFLAVVTVLSVTPTFSQNLKVNTAKSSIKWEGKKIGGAHNGHISLKEGQFSIKNKQIKSGSFIVDMNTITNDDIENEEYREKLIGHLKSEDFFSIKDYPTAKLSIAKCEKFVDNNAAASGDLTIKGKTLPVKFNITRSGKKYTTTLTINRAKYDIRYGSKSFFSNLGDKVIYDDFTLEISLEVN